MLIRQMPSFSRLLAAMAQQWQQKTPTRHEMRTELRKFHVLLEKDMHQKADPQSSREAHASSSKQSFYGDFAQRLREQGKDTETDDWQTKNGKGKSKNKNKRKGKAQEHGNVPKFDLKKIFPSKSITTWQVLARELDVGKEPSGAAAVIDKIEKLAEYQALAEAHNVSYCVIMIVKANEEIPSNSENAVTLWLRYIGNLALAKAVIATTTGVKSDLQGLTLTKNEGKGVTFGDAQMTLRIVVDLELIEEGKLKEHFKKQPHAALYHAIKKTKCHEIKTHGWTVGQNQKPGYCTVSIEDGKQILAQSGESAVFFSRLRQDITEYPPVTWLKVEETESIQDYYKGALKTASDLGVPLARRQGGGAFLGVGGQHREESRVAGVKCAEHLWPYDSAEMARGDSVAH